MKQTKRRLFVAFLLIFVLSLTACSQGKSDKGEKDHNEIATNVFHDRLTVTSKVNGNTVSAQALTFNPADGYLPVVYDTNAGWASTLDEQFKKASEERWGYEVLGVINGSFFSMTDGMLTGIIITDGRITCAHEGFSGEMVTFGTDGVMRVTQSALEYKLAINGQAYDNALYYINKVSQAGSVADKIYYWDSACGTKSDAPEAGYELLFNKVENSELSVGGTLRGELVSVTETTEDTKGIEIGTNQFVLYCKTASPYANSLKNLKAGAQLTIEVNETVEESKEIMENCSSAITNVGWLVKDGEDQTEIKNVIGTHEVTLEARWTAFGTKPDGSYVFFTTEGQATGEGGSVTLKDVAKEMIALGCTNVIRMDGGGSSAMYLCDKGDGKPGFVQKSERAVSDCILLVKQSSMQPTKALKTALDTAITTAKQLYKETNSEEIKLAYEYAEAICEKYEKATEGEYKKACMEISNAISHIEGLKKLIASVEAADKANYSDYAYTKLSSVLANAKTQLDNKASKEDLIACYNDLLYWYSLTGAVDINIATGKSYTTNEVAHATYADTDGKELTDGILGDAANTNAASWAGYNTIDPTSGKTYDIVLDLGEKTDGLRNFSVNVHQQLGWGITVPSLITVYVSDDGKNWKEVSSATASSDILKSIYPGGHTFEVSSSEDISARYVKYSLTPNTSYVFVSEVTAEVHYE